MRLKQNRHSFDTLFVVLLLLGFALFALLLAGTGAAVYKKSVIHLNENYTSRTAISYVSEKIRQADRSDSIFFTELEKLPALQLKEEIDGEIFFTYIYFYENALCELFIRDGTAPRPAMGSPLTELSSFEICPMESASDGRTLFSVTAVSPEGNSLSLLLHCSAG